MWLLILSTILWTGNGADANWSTAENWQDGTVPGASDTATFDSTAAKSAVTIDANAPAVGSLTMASDFTGTITLEQDGFYVRNAFTQAGGTFVAGAHDFYLGYATTVVGTYSDSCQFLFTGGTFHAPSSGHVLRLWGSQKLIFTNQGDWHHENGFVLVGAMGYQVNAQFNSEGKEYYDLEIAGDKQTTFSGDNTVLNHFIHGGGILLPTTKHLDVYGDFTITNYPTANGYIYAQGNTGLKINLVGDKSTKIHGGNHLIAKDVKYKGKAGVCAGWWNPRTTSNITINKSNGAGVTADGGPLNFGSPGWYSMGSDANLGTVYLQNGTLDLSGVSDASFDEAIIKAEDESQLTFPENVSSALGVLRVYGSGFTFQNLELDTYYENTLGTANATNEILGNLIVSRCKVGGASGATLNLHGDLIALWHSTLEGGFGCGLNLRLCGTGDQKLVMTNDFEDIRCPLYGFTIDKPSGRVWVDRDVVVGEKVTLASGTLDLSDHLLCISNTSSFKLIQNGGTILTQKGGGLKFWNDSYPTTMGIQLAGNGELKLLDPISDLIVHVGCNAWTRQSASVERMNFNNRCVITNRMEFLAGQLSANGGSLELQGDFNCAVNEAVDGCVEVTGGNCPIAFTGDRDQRVSFGPKTSNVVAKITVAKTGGRLILDSDWDLRVRRNSSTTVPSASTAQNVELTSGELEFNGHRLFTPPGTTTLGDGFVLAVTNINVDGGSYVSGGTLALPAAGQAGVRLNGRMSPSTPRPVDVIAFQTLTGYDSTVDSWQALLPPRAHKGKMVLDETRKVFSLDYHFLRSLNIILR